MTVGRNHATLRERRYSQCLLKYCTAFSCFSAAAFVLNVPRFLRLPVLGFFFREYNRYLPDLSFLIMEDFLSLDRWQIVGQPLRLPDHQNRQATRLTYN